MNCTQMISILCSIILTTILIVSFIKDIKMYSHVSERKRIGKKLIKKYILGVLMYVPIMWANYFSLSRNIPVKDYFMLIGMILLEYFIIFIIYIVIYEGIYKTFFFNPMDIYTHKELRKRNEKAKEKWDRKADAIKKDIETHPEKYEELLEICNDRPKRMALDDIATVILFYEDKELYYKSHTKGGTITPDAEMEELKDSKLYKHYVSTVKQ